MKHFRSFIFFIFSIAAMMLISCGDDDDGSVADDPAEQTEEEKQLESLSASAWTMSSITLDGADATSNFEWPRAYHQVGQNVFNKWKL